MTYEDVTPELLFFTVLKKLTPTGKKVVSLKGILRGVEITDEEINSVQKYLYSKVGL